MIMPKLIMPIIWLSDGIFFLWSDIQVLDLVRAAKGSCVPTNEFSVKQNLPLMQVESSRRTLDHSVQGMHACNETTDNYGVEN
jgi:hypothetical protein